MSRTNCQYSQYKQSGLEQSLTCSLTGKYCTKQRYCTTQRRLVNTDDWQTCAQLQKEEVKMANNKRNYKKKVEENKPVTDVVEEIKPVEEKEELVEMPFPTIETEEVIISDEEEPKVEEEIAKVIDTKYEVILATKTYYIINKDGKNITIKELNNYKKGDMVIL